MKQELIQILLPLADNEGRRFGRDAFEAVKAELAERFGGVTAFTQSPAEGLWGEDGGTARDRIIIVEVMTAEVDPEWWRDYRRELERRFRQDTVVIRSLPIRLL